ncbi:FAD-dependent oxidoreductase [Ponticaulis sp.]|uniref:NAD(P)/FAD-dependent oxidoreductase n=1 Tax=Ponticaulis sp. TaxID=2020902 RepID=UPI000C4EC3E6|nr:FAD-dependent oxidoreductase [Ponticaulis sp.]MBN02636.1 pyridine nucleotide-disulfide oxidoreductase [Ponticaulis sp.]
MSADQKIVIIGAGQAGGQAAVSLRQAGFEGTITMVGDEPAPPYQRPPLSKAYLKGKLDRERLFLKPLQFYEDSNITLQTGVSAQKIDRAAKTVALSDGETLDYDTLIIATGSRPRALPLPGAESSNVFDLRTLSDIDVLKPNVQEGRRLLIVGAGYIGLEAAAAARELGLEVTVLEMADRVLARVTSPVMSEFYEKLHETHGVTIKTGAMLAELQTQDGAVTAGVLKSGDVIPCDLVLVGIGILPNEEIASEAGIACKNGILVDRDARTNDPSVYAIGDCAHRPLVHYGRDGRLESVHNAIEQGKIVAAHIMDAKRPVEDVPWFWSDQYDVKLQIAGLSQDYDEAVVRGEPTTNSFAVFYFRSGRLISVDAVNAPAEFLTAKRLIAANADISPELVVDQTKTMKDILAEAMAGQK